MVEVDLVRKGLQDFFRSLLLKVLASLTATLVVWLMRLFIKIV